MYKEIDSVVSRSCSVHKNAKLEHPVSLSKNSEIHASSFLGRFSFLGINSVIYPNVHIGRFTSIARNCEIGVAQHPTHFLSTHSFQLGNGDFAHIADYSGIQKVKSEWLHKPTSIGNDVWIGAKSIVMPGLNIGDGSIIAANSVVTKDVKPYGIYAGSPAKLIRFRFSVLIICQLMKLSWWNLDLKYLKYIKFDNIDVAIRQLSDIKSIVSENY